MSHLRRDFMGAKLALYLGDRLLVLQRDDRPGLLWPGCWDLPGGEREPGETPLQTVLRETQEEFGLTVPPSRICWGRAYTNTIGRAVWFFVGQMPARAEAAVRLGDEGQGWALMTRDAFLDAPKAVPQFKTRIADYHAGVAPDRWGRP
jgi:8-oxo-dGTP diphosphatase